jgi:hypothetical protein
MFPYKKDSEFSDDECKHGETTNDDNISCGQCAEYSNIQIPEFSYLKNANIRSPHWLQADLGKDEIIHSISIQGSKYLCFCTFCSLKKACPGR